ncbi:cytochrome c [Litorilinea aerophila]|nr:cytochrome c [Litorilinea aerophila]MCC9075513.1 cytochrome c [Litorilinea aerophila]GIV76399.1 MAG: cytochrome c [Litorilinea sp.]
MEIQLRQVMGIPWQTSAGRLLPVWMAVGLAAVLLSACGGQTPRQASADATAPDGEALYLEYCASCHGERGEGQPNWREPNAQGVYPAPPHDSSGHTWHHPDELLLQIIAQGGGMPNSAMPAFGDRLSRAEMEAILEHIKGFWGPQERAFQQEVTRQQGG